MEDRSIGIPMPNTVSVELLPVVYLGLNVEKPFKHSFTV